MVFFDYLFPRRCLVCRKEGRYLCSWCQQKIRPINYRQHFSDNSQGLDGVLSLFSYRSLAGKLLKDLKYLFVKDSQNFLTDLMVKHLKKERLLEYWKENHFIFLPVPLFPTR
ncbi:MAG: double zinc ribbon domain-containing protein, partial [Patescibacteria group bacterium]